MNKRKILIYGINLQAQQLKHYIDHDNRESVAAFTVNHDYKKEEQLLGLDVVDFENVEEKFPPDEYQILISFGYKNMVRNREEKFYACKDKGYDIYSYISKDALVYTDDIGEGTIIYPGTVIAPSTRLGIGNFIEINASVAHHTTLGDFNFIAPSATICGGCTIGSNCFIAANSTIVNNMVLSDLTFLAAGAILNRATSKNMSCFPAKSVFKENKSMSLKF